MSDEKTKTDWNKLEIGAMWKKTNDKQSFYTGHVTIGGKEVDIVCFSNKHKTDDKHPDIRVYEREDQRPDPIL